MAMVNREIPNSTLIEYTYTETGETLILDTTWDIPTWDSNRDARAVNYKAQSEFMRIPKP